MPKSCRGSYLHTGYEWREAEGTLAQEFIHVAPQLLFNPPALPSFVVFHFLEDPSKQGAEQLFG